jgi:hypothetical protein
MHCVDGRCAAATNRNNVTMKERRKAIEREKEKK